MFFLTLSRNVLKLFVRTLIPESSTWAQSISICMCVCNSRIARQTVAVLCVSRPVPAPIHPKSTQYLPGPITPHPSLPYSVLLPRFPLKPIQCTHSYRPPHPTLSCVCRRRLHPTQPCQAGPTIRGNRLLHQYQDRFGAADWQSSAANTGQTLRKPDIWN